MSMDVIGTSTSTRAMGGAGGAGAPNPPKSVTKSDLESLRDKIAKGGGETKDLDTLIKNFDDTAGEGGSMTAAQFKTYAEKNGVKLPSRPPAGGAPPSGAKPAGVAASGKAGGGGSAQGAKKSSSDSDKDVSDMTASELQQAAARGDLDAVLELAKRARASKAEKEGTASTGTGASTDDDSSADTEIDTYI